MMMKKGSLLSILMSFFSVTLGHAQIIETIAPLGTDISKNEINQNLESENSEQSIDGIHFYSLTRSFNTNKFCSSLPASEVPIKETKEPKFEILLITENPVVEKTGVTLNQSFKNYNYKNNVKLYSDMLPNELNTQEINTVANYVYNHSSPPQNANDIQVAKDAVFIEALIQTIPKVQYSNEATLTGQI